MASALRGGGAGPLDDGAFEQQGLGLGSALGAVGGMLVRMVRSECVVVDSLCGIRAGLDRHPAPAFMHMGKGGEGAHAHVCVCVTQVSTPPT